MPWQRPENVPVGQVWSRFKGKERNGKPAPKYQIRDIGEYKQQCLDLMSETFLKDEPLCHVLGILDDPVSISTIKSNWVHLVSQDISVAVFTETDDGQPDQLVAVNHLVVKSRDDEEEDFDEVKGEPWKKLLKTLITAEELVDVFQLYQVDRYLTSSGLTVLPEHRGQNIGARVFEARKPLCKALGIEATCTVFTAITSQVLAQKCGYTVLAELPYTDMLKYGIDLSASPTKSAKVMGTKFNFND